LAQELVGKSTKPDDYVTAEYLEELHAEMLKAAEEYDFERAAILRDKIAALKGEKVATPQSKKPRGKKGSHANKSGPSASDSAPQSYPKRPPRPKPNGL